jgi:hypothetical protein
MKAIKTVCYDRTGKPIVTVRVKGYNKVLNAPRPQVKLEDIGTKEIKFGF